MMQKERIFNLPNLLSGYRLLSSPYVIYLACTGHEHLFVVLLVINVVTDILDGMIARIFRLQTKFGARLDSLADGGTYAAVACGIVSFKLDEFGSVFPWLLLFLFSFMMPYVVSLLKFGKLPSLHLYSSKIGGTIDGVFLFVLFFFGFNSGLFFAAVGWGVLSFVEMTAVLLMLKELRSDCRGALWVAREKAATGAVAQHR